jgi:hypothetical protein
VGGRRVIDAPSQALGGQGVTAPLSALN